MNILVVDDDPTIREYLEEVFNMMGHNVVSVADGYDAIDYVREHDINLAYIDISIPEIDGFATLTKIRDLAPKVSAVMISGESVDVIMETSFQKGVYVCLAKPFTIEEIEEINEAYSKIRDPLEFIYNNPHGLDIDKISGAKILIVDDEKEIVEVIKECLEYEKFIYVDTVNDGEEAIRKFNEYMHDVVIVDIVMPKKSGIEVLKHVKAISKNSQVIVITANADKDSAVTALKLGAYDYIEKPLDISTLSRIVKRAVEKKLLLDK